MKKYIAEFVGTFTLVLFGCGAAVIGGEKIDLVGISFAFGFALIAMAYGIGPISGCHINPAVSLGVYTAGRMTGKDLGNYIIAQILGGIAGAGVLKLIAIGKAGIDASTVGLGQNGWGTGVFGEYNLGAAFLFELIATLLFVITILGSTQKKVPAELAGLAIGITLVVIHLVGIRITGTSVNPARSIGPALLVGGNAIKQLWLFIVAPSLGGIAAGFLFKSGILAKDEEKKAQVESEEVISSQV